MNKNIKIFLYFTFYTFVIAFLLLSIVIIKSSLGGININYFKKPISEAIKSNYQLDLNLEGLVLERSNERGFYIVIENLEAYGSNKTLIESQLMIYDFNVINLITLSFNRNNKISTKSLKISNSQFRMKIIDLETNINNNDEIIGQISKVSLDYNLYSPNIELHDSNFKINTNSVNELFDTDIIITSTLSLNGESFETSFKYVPKEKKINILKFSGDNFYIEDKSYIAFDAKYKTVETKMHINAKKNPIINILELTPNNQIYSFINSFKGWQSIFLKTSFDYNSSNIFPNISENLHAKIAGIYELNSLLPNNQFYQNFGNLTNYEIEFYNDRNKYVFNINYIKNDLIKLNKGSFVKLDHKLNDANLNLVTSIEKSAVINYLQSTILSRETKTDRVIDFLEKNLNENNDITLNFNINPSSNEIIDSITNLNVIAYGKLDTDFTFDENENPNFILGPIQYYIDIDNLETDAPTIKGLIDLSKTNAFIRQINLQKDNKKSLKIQFDGESNVLNDSLIIFDSLDSEIDFDGKIKITKTNHIFLEKLFINNNSNVNLNLSGDLSERILNLKITGDIIDLSANKVETKKKKRDYYLKRENYTINTKEVIFAGSVRVNDFKADINKQGLNLSVNSHARFNSHNLIYSREKSNNLDINIINSTDITQFVSNDHPAKRLLSDGEFEMTSIRDLDTQEARVQIDLNDFVLINSPASLKLLSLPSISGLVSIAEGEQGIRFGYGEIKYLEKEEEFEEIEAFAVSDSLGLIMEGQINRKEKNIDMKGEISPMHLVNAIIQRLPILGPIIVGEEGEGMFSIDFTMKGSSENPNVESNPLTIIKPRIIERAIEALENSSTIQ